MINVMKENKGLALSLSMFFVGVVTIATVAFLYFLLIGRYYDIQTIILESVLERHNIAMGNVLMTSPTLAYEDNLYVVHKGILEKDKINAVMVRESDATDLKLSEEFTKNRLFSDVSYPNSIYTLKITDFGTGESWVTVGHGPMEIQNFEVSKFSGCVFANLFKAAAQVKCLSDFKTRTGVSHKEFPVSIRIDEYETHPALLTLMATEL